MYAIKRGDEEGVPRLVVPGNELQSKKPFDLRDKKILKFERDKADTLALVKRRRRHRAGAHRQRLEVVKPVPARSDYSAVEGLHHAPVVREHDEAGRRRTPRTSRSTGSTSRR